MTRRRLVITIPQAFNIEDAARQLGYQHRSSAYDLIEAGLLRAYPMGGGALRVPADAIVEYLQHIVDAHDGTDPVRSSGRPSTLAVLPGEDPRRRGAPTGRGGRPRAARQRSD